MMRRLREFWRRVHQQPLNPERRETVTNRGLWRIFVPYFLRPHWAGLLLFVAMVCFTGGLFKYILAWAGQYTADDIVQVQYLSNDAPEAVKFDPTGTEENRTFVLPERRDRTAWSDQAEASPGLSLAQKFRRLGWLAVGLLALVVVNAVIYMTQMMAAVYVGQRVQFRLRRRVYEKLHQLPMRYHDEQSVGQQMTNLFGDVHEIQHLTMMIVNWIPANVLTMVLGMWILFRIDASLAMLVMLALPCYGFCYTWFHGRQRIVAQNLRERQGRLNAHVNNRIRNFYLVKSFVREIAESIDLLRRSRPIIQDSLSSAVLGGLFGVVCTIITGVCMVVVLWAGALRVRDGEITLGQLLLFYASAGYMFSPIAGVSGFAAWFHRLRTVCHKIVRVLDEPISISDPKEALPVPSAAAELRFQNVTLRYGAHRSPALRNISFTLPAGASLCVMGPSGAGKSTLARLAARVYDPTEGEVLVDGNSIRRYKLAHLRQVVGFVNQEPIIFDGSLRDNIRYGSEHRGNQHIVTAAQYAQIHDFIVRLPDRYETLTCERGLTLSGGQKQRVNLARVLLYDPKLLILDDCTSALDAETEARLVEGFDEVLRDRTCLLISHRISIAVRCDYVMMLEEGQMVEWGRPEALLRGDGPFAELQRQQISKGRNVLSLQAAEA
ncbi:MAG: ABC transporter ATP-binding protein [Phycisphaerae bacterium]|nr:ABC transporter ATP-binding protein [Phycisphaerae bacterium]